LLHHLHLLQESQVCWVSLLLGLPGELLQMLLLLLALLLALLQSGSPRLLHMLLLAVLFWQQHHLVPLVRVLLQSPSLLLLLLLQHQVLGLHRQALLAQPLQQLVAAVAEELLPAGWLQQQRQ
jgi:hypothetical protein